MLSVAISLSIVGWFQSGTILERSDGIANISLKEKAAHIAERFDSIGGGRILSSISARRASFLEHIDELGQTSQNNEKIAAVSELAAKEEPVLSPQTQNTIETQEKNETPTNEIPSGNPKPPVPTGNGFTPESKPAIIATPPSNTGGLRILTAGDSMMGEIAYALRRQAKSQGFFLFDTHKPSTGLTNPNYYDWKKELPEFIAKHAPNIVVFMVGANDAQDMKTQDGKWVRFGSDSWKEEYSSRISRIAAIAEQAGTKLVWVGLPPMKSSEYDRKMRIIADLHSSMSNSGKFRFIPTTDVLGINGDYSKDLPRNGKTVSVRANDGIHLTVAGGESVASLVSETLSLPEREQSTIKPSTAAGAQPLDVPTKNEFSLSAPTPSKPKKKAVETNSRKDIEDTPLSSETPPPTHPEVIPVVQDIVEPAKIETSETVPS